VVTAMLGNDGTGVQSHDGTDDPDGQRRVENHDECHLGLAWGLELAYGFKHRGGVKEGHWESV
jgi:hypothetical protein